MQAVVACNATAHGCLHCSALYFCHVHVQDASVDELFRLLEAKTGVPPDEARLIHAGKELVQKQGRHISDYPTIVHGSNLFMVMRLKGGELSCCMHDA